MTKRMLIDATHAEETRVVVLDGNRLEDFDVETSTKKQLKGNIYLAKVIRVEPSLQAAFVEYGGNRHGFLAFGEIHPDYYQIPIADRQRLLEMQAEELREQQEAEDREVEAEERGEPPPPPAPAEAAALATDLPVDAIAGEPVAETPAEPGEAAAPDDASAEAAPEADEAPPQDNVPPADVGVPATLSAGIETIASDAPPPETVGGEGPEDRGDRRIPPRFMRQYKIQEVIRRRQILLVQVVKEERGNKGAALTTYLSLAGRYCVLMPNSPRGGGISRKITSAADRKRLREVMDELALPDGMGMIVRTAGAGRPKPEIKRDCEYLLRLWDNIRETTLTSTAPALIYEEASLIKRAIRDVYARDVDEILVDGDDAYRAAKDYMRMLMPSHAKKVQIYKDGGTPLFAKAGVEQQLDAMHSATVQLRSGGYLVINQTEALVSIDVNSGRSTRERGIEETALRTNMEAAEELGRQLRLRDLAGLIVIDFIDMESKKHNAQVERKLKDALKNDRARIQVGHISHFGLLEMSRQRLRPSLVESNFISCPHCNGTGLVRSVESSAVHVLRAIEEEGAKRKASEIMVRVAGQIALYILNQKRDRLGAIEARYGMRVLFDPDPSLVPPQVKIERLKAALVAEAVTVPSTTITPESAAEPEEAQTEAEAEAEAAADTEAEADSEEGASESGDGRRRRRRRRGNGRREDGEAAAAPADEAVAAEPAPAATEGEATDAPPADAPAEDAPAAADAATDGTADDEDAEGDDQPRRRRRGRRGGRRRRRDGEAGAPEEGAAEATAEEATDAPAPVYAGPTPADPFGGQVDIFDVMDAAERAAEAGRPVAAMVATPAAEAAARDAEVSEEAATAGQELAPVEAEVQVAETAVAAEPVVAVEAAPEPVHAVAAAEPPTATDMPQAAVAEEPVAEAPRTPATEPALEPEAAQATATEEPAPEAPRVIAAEPSPAPEAAAAEPAPAPEAPHVAVEPSPGVQPIMVGDANDNEAAPKRRGWWRR